MARVYMKDEAETKLSSLQGWKFSNNGMEKEFSFKDFKMALAFINKVGEMAEQKNHHPEIFNVYNKVKLRLSTHDAGGVTDKDFELAKMIDQ
jgi:4a-hydroxytetrahydrobiopterin dehydratase